MALTPTSTEKGADDVSDAERGRSVNWMTGMLLTPWHFLRQDTFTEERSRWILRYCVPGSGLLGGGMNVSAEDRGAARHDPRLEVQDDGETVRLSLIAARGITAAGIAVDIDETCIVRASVPREELAGLSEVLVSVSAGGNRIPDDATVGTDPQNPDQAALLKPHYELHLAAPAELSERALVVGRIVRTSTSAGFDRDGDFIPACVTVSSHSELYRGWQSTGEQIAQLSDRLVALHRVARDYMEHVGAYGFDTGGASDIISFVERAALALESCAYEVINPNMSPGDFFQQVSRLGHGVAVALEISPATRAFIGQLTELDVGYAGLLESERAQLARKRQWNPTEETRRSLNRCRETVGRLKEVVGALEGRFDDYRLSRTVGSRRFLIERDGERFFTSVANPMAPRVSGNLETFEFSGLGLQGQGSYRVLLIGRDWESSPWEVGESFDVDLHLNSGRDPLSQSIRCDVMGQRNFAVDFESPADVGTINMIKVTVHGRNERVVRALLYARRRGVPALASAPQQRAATLRSAQTPSSRPDESQSIQGGDVGSREAARTPTPAGQVPRDPTPASRSGTPAGSKRIPLPSSDDDE